jgi:hypothetical protein
MTSARQSSGINPEVPPSGTGCADRLAGDGPGWWFHLRRCAECGQIGCCDSSPSQHATGHAHHAGHPILASFEPGEHWFYDTGTGQVVSGPPLAEPSAHPASQPVPGPEGNVPANWQTLLHH